MSETQIVGKARKVVKQESRFRQEILRRSAEASSGARSIRNTTTRYCIFSLDTTRPAAQNPPNFFRGLPVQGDRYGPMFAARSYGGPGTFNVNGKNRASFQRGKKRAVFAGMDCSMHQSGMRGSRPLAARRRLRRRTLQQLQRSAPQRSTANQPTPADASPLAGQLSSTGPLARTTAVIAASDPQGRSSRSHRDEPSPQEAQPLLAVRDSLLPVSHAFLTIPKPRRPGVSVLLKPALNRCLKWGERPVGGPAARGAWANSRKLLLSRSYRIRSAGPVKLRKTSTASTEMQIAVIIGVLGRSE